LESEKKDEREGLTAKGVTCLCDRSSPEKEKLREEEEEIIK
jgi:hypothetical protein